MPARELPLPPNLENLKKQAKRLHKRLRSGDPETVSRLRRGLPRLSRTAAAEVPAAGVTLQEAQHVLAVEYGYANWKELIAMTGDTQPTRRKIRNIPIRPGLPNLQRDAEFLHSGTLEGRPWCVPRIKRHIPRLANLADEEIPGAGVTLEEARHAVAMDYGYADWRSLEAELSQLKPVDAFEDLAELEDDEIREVIVRLGRDKLAVVFKAASERFKDRFLDNMSAAEWQALKDAMKELGPMPLSEVQAAQARLLQHYRSDDPLV